MNLVTPEPGLIIWTTIAFVLLLIILRKYAWKPILKAIKDREKSIEDALQSAAEAKEQMAQLKADNEKIINEAKKERDKLMKEAREIRDQIISEAKEKSVAEGNKIIESARQQIENDKKAAIEEIRNKIADFSVEIAEKLLRKELADDKEQKELINILLKEITVN